MSDHAELTRSIATAGMLLAAGSLVCCVVGVALSAQHLPNWDPAERGSIQAGRTVGADARTVEVGRSGSWRTSLDAMIRAAAVLLQWLPPFG